MRAAPAGWGSLVAGGLAGLGAGFVGGVLVGRRRGVPFLRRRVIWSIGIYAGRSPVDLAPAPKVANPVLTAADVSDVPAVVVADPFMVRREGRWYMFFEVLEAGAERGRIGLATSADGLRWSYERLVLREPFHLSYPYVFAWDGADYMLPETYEANEIRLYRADRFPDAWSHVATLMTGHFLDASLFRHAGRWWLFADTSPRGSGTLRLYSSVDLRGLWAEHPASPIVRNDSTRARPGGRVLVLPDRLIRYGQNDLPSYGTELRAFEILELTADSYREREVASRPLLGPSGHGWNAEGMHHVDPHDLGDGRWLACVDGFRRAVRFGLRY